MTTAMQTHRTTTVPRADLFRSETEHLLLLDMPGVAPADLEVHLDDHVLTVEGRVEVEAPGELRTRGWQPAHYKRAFTIGDHIDPDAIEARLEQGTLVVRLPHLPEAQPRRIEVLSA